MSRMPLGDVPSRVSWYRPLASAAALLKSISSLPGPPVPASRYLTVIFELMGIVVTPVPVKLPLGADSRSWIWLVVK